MKYLIFILVSLLFCQANSQDVVSITPVIAFSLTATGGASKSFNKLVNVKSAALLPAEARLVIVTLEASAGKSGVTQAVISLWNNYRPFGDSSLYRCFIYNNTSTTLSNQRQYIIELNNDGSLHIQAGLSGSGAKSVYMHITGYIK